MSILPGLTFKSTRSSSYYSCYFMMLFVFVLFAPNYPTKPVVAVLLKY